MICPICENMLTLYIAGSEYFMSEKCALVCKNCGFELKTEVPWYTDYSDGNMSEEEHDILCRDALTKMYNDFCKKLEDFK